MITIENLRDRDLFDVVAESKWYRHPRAEEEFFIMVYCELSSGNFYSVTFFGDNTIKYRLIQDWASPPRFWCGSEDNINKKYKHVIFGTL